MNTANVMAVNVQASAKSATSTKANATGKAAKSSNASKSFDDTLGKLSDEGKETFVPENTQGSKAASTSTDAPSSDVSQDGVALDPLAADIAAAENVAANVAVDVAQAVNAEQGGDSNSLAPIAEVEVQQVATQNANLQTLLPQSDADAAKSQDFLAMLSGQQLKGAANAQNLVATEVGKALETQLGQSAPVAPTATVTSTEPQTIVDISSPLTLLNATKNASTATILEAQLATTQQGDLAQVALENQPLDMADTLAGATESTPVAAVAMSETIATTAPQVAAQAMQANRAQADGNSISTLVGDNVTVEEDIEPLRVVREAAMADNSAMDADSESSGQQLASQAETIPASAETESQAVPTTSATTNAQVSTFQQSLQDSILGTSDTQSAQQAQQPQDSYEITRQIVDQARLIRRGEDTQMVIKLNPEHLGELTLKVSVTANGSVNASFHSDNATVRTIIENSLVQLKQELNDQGLKVENVDVYAALDGGLPQDQGQQDWQNGESGRSNYRALSMDAEDYEAEADDLAAIAAEAAGTGVTADGVDYRI